MNVDLIAEPELEFGTGSHVDIRFGLRNGGPVTSEVDTAPKEIKVGFVGTAKTIEAVQRWMTACSLGVAAKTTSKPNFFPAFPGFGKEGCFQCDWVTAERMQRAIPIRDITTAVSSGSQPEAVRNASELFFKECKYLIESTNADVIICAPPIELLNVVDQPSEGRDLDEEAEFIETRLDFHDMLKARSLVFKRPLQFIRPSTYDENVKEVSQTGRRRQLQDPATRAWNFFTALYYKAGGTPWRLRRQASDLETCYIGISFYHTLDRAAVHTSVAQVFNERGEGMILRGGEAKISKTDKTPHLTATAIAELLSTAIRAFEQEHRHAPARVVVHKSSRFNPDELRGVHECLDQARVACHDILVIRETFLRLFRDGQYPPLRGTFLELEPGRIVLYTRGSTPFYQMYPGMYIPRPVELFCVEAESPSRLLAEEVLALTKMNWNNTQFDSSLPITLRAARQVGAILKYVPSSATVTANYASYM